MKTISIILIILTLITACSLSSSDFRKATWGMSSEQILSLEGKPLKKWSGQLLYEVDFEGYPSTCWFLFDNDELISGGYSFDYKDENKSKELFTYLDNILESKYGPGKSEKDPLGGNQIVRTSGNNLVCHQFSTDLKSHVITYISKENANKPMDFKREIK